MDYGCAKRHSLIERLPLIYASPSDETKNHAPAFASTWSLHRFDVKSRQFVISHYTSAFSAKFCKPL